MTIKKILLVEDTTSDEILILRSLRKAQVVNEIVLARDGQEAVDYFNCTGRFAGRSAGDLPAMVLLDLNLPRLSGFEVLQHIRSREETQFLPVVILTSSDEEDDIANGYVKGANSYVRKPVDTNRFNEVVRQVGLYWALVNEPAPALLPKVD